MIIRSIRKVRQEQNRRALSEADCRSRWQTWHSTVARRLEILCAAFTHATHKSDSEQKVKPCAVQVGCRRGEGGLVEGGSKRSEVECRSMGQDGAAPREQKRILLPRPNPQSRNACSPRPLALSPSRPLARSPARPRTYRIRSTSASLKVAHNTRMGARSIPPNRPLYLDRRSSF